MVYVYFFFQAEDGIRDYKVTGVQTCALPILDGHTFHLTDPEPLRVGEVLNTFCRAGHAPEMTMRIDARMFAFVPSSIRGAVGNLPPVKRFIGMLLRDFKIPKERSEEHTSELQSPCNLVCRLLL